MMRVISALLFATIAVAQSDPLVSGLEAFRRGDYETAERELKRSTDPRAAVGLALTQAAMNRCAEAEPALRKADSAPADLKRLAGLALTQCQIAANNWDGATASISKFLASYPGDADGLYLFARLHMRAWNDGIRQLYKTNPSSYRVNQISGEILETQGQFQAAAAEYRKALEKNPEALNLHFRLGRALLMAGHSPETFDAALKEFEAELAHNPRDAVAHYQVAQVLLAQSKPKEAAGRLDQALQIEPNFPEALIAQGKLLLEDKRNNDAIQLLTRAVKLMPRSEAAHYSLMMAYRNAGKMTEARQEKAELDKLQKVPEGEFTEFLKKLGEKPPEK